MKLKIGVSFGNCADLVLVDDTNDGKVVHKKFDDYLPSFIGIDFLDLEIDPETGQILNWDKSGYKKWVDNNYLDDGDEDEDEECYDEEYIIESSIPIDNDKYYELAKIDNQEYKQLAEDIAKTLSVKFKDFVIESNTKYTLIHNIMDSSNSFSLKEYVPYYLGYINFKVIKLLMDNGITSIKRTDEKGIGLEIPNRDLDKARVLIKQAGLYEDNILAGSELQSSLYLDECKRKRVY